MCLVLCLCVDDCLFGCVILCVFGWLFGRVVVCVGLLCVCGFVVVWRVMWAVVYGM